MVTWRLSRADDLRTKFMLVPSIMVPGAHDDRLRGPAES
jgi:hypothetical protein